MPSGKPCREQVLILNGAGKMDTVMV